MVDSSRTQLASKFLGYKTIYAYSFIYAVTTHSLVEVVAHFALEGRTSNVIPYD